LSVAFIVGVFRMHIAHTIISTYIQVKLI